MQLNPHDSEFIILAAFEGGGDTVSRSALLQLHLLQPKTTKLNLTVVVCVVCVVRAASLFNLLVAVGAVVPDSFQLD